MIALYPIFFLPMATKNASTGNKKAATKTTAKKDSPKTTNARVSVSRATANKKASTRGKKSVETMDDLVTEQSLASRIPSVPSFSKRPSKRFIAIAATIIVLGGLVYLISKYAIIGWVDNKPITKFQLYSNLEKRYGNDTREQLIVEQLILSEAKQKNLSVSDEELAAEIANIEQQQGGADQLAQILQVQGISQDEFRNLVKLQLFRTKIFGEGVNVTDEQVNQYITENQESLPAATAGAAQAEKDQLRKDVMDQLKQQEISQKFNQWLQTTLQSDRVKRS